MTPILETERLFLRKLETGDGEFILRLQNTPGWRKYIGNRGVSTVEEAQLYLLTGPINSYEKLGFGLYLVEKKEGRLPIGICGLIKREALEDVDLGFAFLPEHNGCGFAFEAAKATLTYAVEELGIQKIVSVTNNDNSRSIHLLKKLGLVFQKQIRLPGDTKQLHLFANSRH